MPEAAPTTPGPKYSVRDLRRRMAGAAALETLPGGDGDHRFNPGSRRQALQAALRDAAVLIPVVDRPGQATVILTKRAETLRAHGGQTAFPGGRIDPEDATPEQAALREAREEIGLASRHVEVIGRLPDYLSGSGYRIAPVLGIVAPGFALTLNPDEVDAAFEAPLAFLMDPANHSRQSRRWNDQDWFHYEMPYGDRRIWGVTAGIIRTLYERLYA